MLQTQFIYQPCSGPEWLANPGRLVETAGPREGLRLPVVEWANGCAHAIGHHLAVYTAAPRAHWRDCARSLAAEIAVRTGGLAWDVRGDVSLLLPTELYAQRALRALWAVRAAQIGPGSPGPEAHVAGVTPDLVQLAKHWPASSWDNLPFYPEGETTWTADQEPHVNGGTMVTFTRRDEHGDTFNWFVTAPWSVSAIYGVVAPQPEAHKEEAR